MTRRFRLGSGGALALGFALACSGATKKAPPKQCTEFGQQCEFAPGKLGACVVKEGCTVGDCLQCQAQH